MENNFFKIFSAFIIPLFICVSGCLKEERKTVRLVITTPIQEMNTISDPSIHDSPTFLARAANDFAAQYAGALVEPDIKTFNYVDEVKAVTGSFDTETAPDILFGAFFNLSGYIDTGRVVPLDDIISPELRRDIDEKIWEPGMRDGKVYLMPYLWMQNILIYNKKLFRQCGLDQYTGQGREIRNWTIPQWEHILDTLAAKLPHGIYPLAIFAKNNQGDTHIMTYLRAFGAKIFNDKGYFDFQTPPTIRALAWLQEGVRKGWFPPHPENLEMKDCSELFANGQLAIYMFNNANRAIYNNLDNYGFVNYPGNLATAFHNGFAVFDNGDPDRLRAARDFMAFIFGKDKWRDLSAGNIPASKRTLEKYGNRITMIGEFGKNSVNVVDFMNNSPNWQGKKTSVRSVFWPNINKLLALKITPEECAAALDKACNAALEEGYKNRKLHQAK